MIRNLSASESGETHILLAADIAKVSSATIRNWIKTGYLISSSRGYVDTISLIQFLSTVAGKDKLVSRANKSLKNLHDHQSFKEKFLREIENLEINIDRTMDEYESTLSDSHRNNEGIYYTPEGVVHDLFKELKRDTSNVTFLDPCCGSGNFIVRALHLGISPENIYGYDVDVVAVECTKRRIFELSGYRSENIVVGDFLEVACSPCPPKFDIIYTNPPWGKKYEKQDKVRFSSVLGSGKSVDSCSLFFFAIANCINKAAEVGLVLPESFFNIASFEDARKRVLTFSILSIIDYGKPFKGLLSKAYGIIFENSEPDRDAEVKCRVDGKIHYRTPESFRKNPKSIINFRTDSASEEVIQHLLSLPHTTLAGKAEWGLGIVTGNNEKFSYAAANDGLIPVIKGSDITKVGLIPPTLFIPEDLSLYQQVAPADLYKAPVKLIYKFISSNLCFYCDREQRYVLNSANMIIPSKNFPVSPDQLCAILNSNIINWFFYSLFGTYKILRGDLEYIPIFPDYFLQYPSFDEEQFLEFLSIIRGGDGSYRIKK